MKREERDRRIIALAEKGRPYHVIAKRYRVSPQRISQIVDKHEREQQNLSQENSHAIVTADQTRTLDLVTAHLIGQTTALIDDHARRAGVSAKLLAERLARAISSGEGR